MNWGVLKAETPETMEMDSFHLIQVDEPVVYCLYYVGFTPEAFPVTVNFGMMELGVIPFYLVGAKHVFKLETRVLNKSVAFRRRG